MLERLNAILHFLHAFLDLRLELIWQHLVLVFIAFREFFHFADCHCTYFISHLPHVVDDVVFACFEVSVNYVVKLFQWFLHFWFQLAPTVTLELIEGVLQAVNTSWQFAEPLLRFSVDLGQLWYKSNKVYLLFTAWNDGCLVESVACRLLVTAVDPMMCGLSHRLILIFALVPMREDSALMTIPLVSRLKGLLLTTMWQTIGVRAERPFG